MIMKKRILGLLLATILLISVVPVQAVITEFSTDIADGSWICVDEALRVVVTMPDEAGAESASYNKVSVYVNGSQTAVASSSRSTVKPDDGVILHIPQNTLLLGLNTIAFKATDADGNQVGETQTITVNGFKALNSTIISETDFNSTSDAYVESYEATLTSDGWTYNDFAAQTETSYLSPEVLYGCDTVIWNDVSAGSHTVTRTNRSDDSDDLYLQCSTTSGGSGANLEFKLKEKEYTFPGEIIKASMDIFSNESDAFRLTTSRVEDTVANPTCELIPFENMRSGWYRLVAYFDPYSKTGASYLYNNDGKLIGNDILVWSTEENGLKLTGKSGSFGFYLRVKPGKTAGFDNIKFERFAIGHYDNFSVVLPQSLNDDKLMYSDATEMTVIAYGEEPKVYVDKKPIVAVSSDDALSEYYYRIDGGDHYYGIKHIQVDYKNGDKFETVYKDITLLQTSGDTQMPYIKDLYKFGTPQTDIPYHILSTDDMTTGIRVNVSAQFPSMNDFRATIFEIDESGNETDVSTNFKKAAWKNSGKSYAIAPSSEKQFNPNCFYKVIIDGHSIYFYTPGDSGAYLNLYDAQLKDGEFSVRAEKAASTSLDAAKLIVAVYNDDELVGINVKDLTINEGVSADGISVKYAGDATNAKAFILDGLDSIKPLITNIEVK